MESALRSGVVKVLAAGESLDFSDDEDDTSVSEPVSAENVDIVSTEFIVEERFGLGNPLKDGKSQDIDFLGVGRLELASGDAHAEGGTEGRSLWILLRTLLV